MVHNHPALAEIQLMPDHSLFLLPFDAVVAAVVEFVTESFLPLVAEPVH
jgi:hypothetical protein